MAFSSSRDSQALPDRWLNCPRMGNTMQDTPFIAFKTPLGVAFERDVPASHRFTPEMVVNRLRSINIELGLVVNLTKTTRYYGPDEFESHGVRFVQIMCAGHGQCPTPEETARFISVCAAFNDRNPHKFIGVHCTHGFNRTGFLIVAYLVERQMWSVEAAISVFARARPPGIYKRDYLAELCTRFGGNPNDIDVPTYPDWDAGVPPSAAAAGNGASRKRSREDDGDDRERPTSDFAIPGLSGVVPVLGDRRLEILRRVCELCNWRGLGLFPGAQPVSLDRRSLGFLGEEPYKVSWKADGTRYMMLIDGPRGTFLTDRNECVFEIKNAVFPYRKDHKILVKDTLVDGELVIDDENNTKRPRYLIYDAVVLMKFPIGQETYSKRLEAIELELIRPRAEAAKESGGIPQAPFGIHAKQFFPLEALDKVLHMKLAHETDGLILAPARRPYECGRCDRLLKWKPADLNSADFRVAVTRETKEGHPPRTVGQLLVGGREGELISIGHLAPMPLDQLRALDGKIVECRLVNGEWVFMRERNDKMHPNGINTYNGVLRSIRDGLTEEQLVEYVRQHRPS